jgi:acetylornithine deacetylase/succinyl-diaminopimelate desuccinylase-like protein
MSTAASNAEQQALAYVDEHRDTLLEDLKAFLRIPSISTLPKHKSDVRRAAQFVATQLTAIGFKKVRLIKALEGHHPLVYGEWMVAKGKPTILIYGHYDVQPVDPRDLWRSDPFEPEVRNGNIYARGAVDDKGQMLALVKTLEALMRTQGALPVNVRVLIEGEEECGGEAIEAYVTEHPETLACDAVLVADTGMPAPDVPAIVYSLRGILYTEIEAKGAKRDLHSGVFGGVAPNPLHALALVLADLKGRDGRINIPGLYEKVKPIPADERKLWARNPVDEVAVLKREMGIDALPGEQDYPPLERIWARPTLEVHGIVGGFVGEGAKTVIPAEARAKVSLRLPPGITPQEVLPLLRRRVADLCPPGVTMTVTFLHGGAGVLMPLDNIFMRAAERAVEQEWGRPPVLMREGGSIPVGALFDSVLHAPIIFMGTGLPDDNVHAPNEKYSLPNYYHLIRQAIRFLEIAGNDPAVVARPGTATKAQRASKPTTSKVSSDTARRPSTARTAASIVKAK